MKRLFFSVALILSGFLSFAQFKNGHQYVDLGLRSGNLWATCNMGASSPTGYGDYYAWGELSPKYHYDWNSYKFYSPSKGLTKYTRSDALDVLEPEDDAAHITWGGNWQIPTWSDWRELLDGVTVYTVRENGIEYFRLKSNNNSNELIIPLNGFKEGTGVFSRGNSFCIWLSSAKDEAFTGGNDDCAIAAISNNEGDTYIDLAIEASRCKGFAIRPVYCKEAKMSKTQWEARSKKEEERARAERESEVYPAILTDKKPVFQGEKDYAASVKAYREYLKDAIGREFDYSFRGTIIIGKDGRVREASISSRYRGPDNIESLFKKAALSSPKWTPAAMYSADGAVNCEIQFSVTNP